MFLEKFQHHEGVNFYMTRLLHLFILWKLVTLNIRGDEVFLGRGRWDLLEVSFF